MIPGAIPLAIAPEEREQDMQAEALVTPLDTFEPPLREWARSNPGVNAP